MTNRSTPTDPTEPEMAPRLQQAVIDEFAQATLVAVDQYFRDVPDPAMALGAFARGLMKFELSVDGLRAVLVKAEQPVAPELPDTGGYL